jgi:hypothetical protein
MKPDLSMKARTSSRSRSLTVLTALISEPVALKIKVHTARSALTLRSASPLTLT